MAVAQASVAVQHYLSSVAGLDKQASELFVSRPSPSCFGMPRCSTVHLWRCPSAERKQLLAVHWDRGIEGVQSVHKPGCWKANRLRSTVVRSQAEATEELTVDNATVLVVGGGGVGLETLKSLAKAGSWVTAYQRHDKYRKDIEELGAMLAIGDVLDPEGIAKAFRTNTFDAVVCTVGGGTTEPTVDREGPINLINAAKKAGVKRFILITSIGVGESKAAVTPQTYEVLKAVLLAKEEAEKHLKESGLTWTILRPGGLKSDPATGRAILLEDTTVGGLIPRADVASVIKQILFDKRTEFKTFSVIDKEATLPSRSLEGVNIFSLA